MVFVSPLYSSSENGLVHFMDPGCSTATFWTFPSSSPTRRVRRRVQIEEEEEVRRSTMEVACQTEPCPVDPISFRIAIRLRHLCDNFDREFFPEQPKRRDRGVLERVVEWIW